MAKFCSNCGNKLNEKSNYCDECGLKINSVNDNKIKVKEKKKVPGKGLSIAGMVIGIVAALWCSQTLLAFFSLDYIVSTLRDYTSSYLIIGFAFGFTLFSFIPSIVGLLLSAFGMKKNKNGFNISGLILNIVSLSISVIEFVYILSFI